MNRSDPALLRDVLAIDRTVLANERTLLAYGRTLLALLATGVGILHFVTEWWAIPTSACLMSVGVLLFSFGLWRYRVVDLHLRRALRDLGQPRESNPM